MLISVARFARPEPLFSDHFCIRNIRVFRGFFRTMTKSIEEQIGRLPWILLSRQLSGIL